MKDIRKSLARGAIWLTATRVGLNLLGFISTVVLARILTPADFGLVAIATAVLTVTMAITELSLASALIHREELLDDHFHSVWTISLLRSLSVLIIFAILAYPIAKVYGDDRLIPILLISGLTGALGGMGNPKLITLSKQLIFWQEFVVQLSKKGGALLVTVVLALLTHSYWSIIWGGLAGALISLIWSYALVPYLPRLSLAKFRDLFSYSFWLSMGDTVNIINWKIDPLLLGYVLGKPQLGLYSMADNFSQLPTREATAPITATLFPAFSRLAHDPERLRAAYLRVQSTLGFIALPVGFGFAGVAGPMVQVVLGAKWIQAAPLLSILSCAFCLTALSSGLQPVAMAKGETKILFGRDVRTFVIRVPFIVGGLLLGGLMGVVIGRAISSVLGTLINTELVKRLTGISILEQISINLRSLICATFMLVVILASSGLLHHRYPMMPKTVELLVLIVVGLATYALAILALWRVQGRPRGPETEIVSMIKSILARRSDEPRPTIA